MPWRQYEKSSMARTYVDLQKNKISANLLQTEKEENNKEEVKKERKIPRSLQSWALKKYSNKQWWFFVL